MTTYDWALGWIYKDENVIHDIVMFFEVKKKKVRKNDRDV